MEIYWVRTNESVGNYAKYCIHCIANGKHFVGSFFVMSMDKSSMHTHSDATDFRVASSQIFIGGNLHFDKKPWKI